MPENHTRLLARIKLRETERQRNRLRDQYDAIEARVAAARDPLDRLRALYEGLRAVTFAQRPLHPDVRELDALYLADHLGAVPPELIADRTRFLEHELAQGRLRAEFTYAFGRVLSEWVGGEGASRPDRPLPADDPIPGMWADPPQTDLAWLSHLVAANAGVFGPVADRVGKFGRTEALRPVTAQEVADALAGIRNDPHLVPGLRRQAAEAAASTTQLTELAGVATILLNSLDEWDWPATGVPLRAVWIRVKHRPYLDEDLVTAVLLQSIGLRWAGHFRAVLRWDALPDGREPLFGPEPPAAPTAVIARDRLAAQGRRFMGAVPLDPGGRSGGYESGGLVELLETIEREVRFARAAFPDRACYVVQADLKDFYPTLPHAFALEILRHLGVPDRWRAFFEKFLAARVRVGNEPHQLRRGVALDHVLSDVLAEVVLWVLDLHAYRAAGVPLIRLVDDIWFVTDSADRATAGWAAIREFCRATRLRVNPEKSGAVCLGDETALPDGLPTTRPRWGLLRFRPDGSWEVDEPAFARLETTLREELAASPSVLALVARYNGYLGYVRRQLALPVTLRGDHLRRVGRRLGAMHDGLFGPGHGLVEEVGRRLRDCFADARLKEQGLPHALLYWPITAGGLALAHPLLHVAAHLRGHAGWAEPRPPSREGAAAYLWRREADARKVPLGPQEEALLAAWDPERPGPPVARTALDDYRRAVARSDRSLPDPEEVDVVMSALWAVYYRGAVGVRSPAGPPPLPAMEGLVQDFVARGGEVSGRTQSGLSSYWRWVVYAYGPSLLSALGTFRFLTTELVPLQLILENRGLAAGQVDPGPASQVVDTGGPPADFTGPDFIGPAADPDSEIPF